MYLKVGDTYEIEHARKGNFAFRVTDINGEWSTGVVTRGVADARRIELKSFVGDNVMVRNSLILACRKVPKEQPK